VGYNLTMKNPFHSKGGRPPKHGEKLLRTTVYLTAAQVQDAHRAGMGNTAEGIRLLLNAGIRTVRGSRSAGPGEDR
jgi:hypothetical protein